MNLKSKIDAAVRCLEREYPKGIDQPTLDYVIAEITREHRAEMRFKFKSAVAGALARLSSAVSRMVWPQSRRDGADAAHDHWVLP
jgi:hypothetical protein